MTELIQMDPAKEKSRWVAFFDLLGFGELIKVSTTNAFSRWAQCLEDLHAKLECQPKLEYAYFSDTFLVYSEDDSAASFAQMAIASQQFFEISLLKSIPFRGAMSCGKFYADKSKSIFIGEALVEASKLEQKYNWVGFVLCESSINKAKTIPEFNGRLPLPYVKWSLLPKCGKAKTIREEVIALLPSGARINGESIILKNLKNMSEQTTNAKVIEKYNNSIEFLEKCSVEIAQNPNANTAN